MSISKSSVTNIYTTEKFIEEYTYTGEDLGAVWSPDSTTFKVWAPTAEQVQLALYKSGTAGTDDLMNKIHMTKIEKGVWSITVDGNLNGTYYTYFVTNDGKETEACDPYARTTGVNGNRAMVIDLTAANPEGWSMDASPNKIKNYTDAVLYELHVRDFSIDESSGVSAAHRGKFLAFTEKGTKTAGGAATGVDYLKELGVTHVHLLPSYDYGSVDESRLDEPQFNWGYDPVNYNVPEGSYSTDPFHGEVRVKEMKQMVKALHDNGINVVMDVVYNHVYDADTFCFNKIVPGYFSRQNADGTYSNGSYCGNDTASERIMVQKYIVDSIFYWADEYHIDGFRFDLVGLLDTETINKLVEKVHAKYPNVIFYGEGWDLPTAVEEGHLLAIQKNADKTPDFAYFSDNIRDLIAGRNGEETGFVSGAAGCEEEIGECFMAQTPWCPKPTQTVNYVSCHDNYTLMDKLRITKPDASREELIRMNKLSAAVYMLSQGIPFIHAGEEFLRIKEDENGKIVENSFDSSDFVNRLRWYQLEDPVYRDVLEYYKGLIQFRKNHAALRLIAAEEVKENVRYQKMADDVVLFEINGKVNGEEAQGIVVIFNASVKEQQISLDDAGAAAGEWKICIDNQHAGTEILESAAGRTVRVAPTSAKVLICR